MGFRVEMELSGLQKHRRSYVPELPPCLQGTTVQVELGDSANVADPSDAQSVCRSFPLTYGQPLVHFLTELESLKRV